MKLVTSLMVSLSAMILCLSLNASTSVYRQRFDDSRGVFFTEEAFGIKADGKHDVSDALQTAINKVKEERNFGVLYIPEGKYLISKTIYVPGSIRLIGYGEKRPEFILGKDTPGFSEHENYMFWFTGGLVEEGKEPQDAGAGTFYSGFSNIDIRIEKGNPMAIGLRTHYAQHGILNHCTFNIGDGYAGVYDLGNEAEDLQFFGGRYGISTGRTSPGWPMVMVDVYFENQREAAIISRNTGLAIVNMRVKNSPIAVNLEKEIPDRLFMEDCSFENVTGTAIAVSAEQGACSQVNLVNIHCKNVPTLASLSSETTRITSQDKSYKVSDFRYGIISKEMGDNPEYGLEYKIEPETFPEAFTRTIPALPDMATWVSVAKYGAKGDGIADDTEAIQKAIDENENIFVPEGWYKITKTIRFHKGTKLIGLHPFSTQFFLQESTPAFSGFGAPTPMVESSEGGDDILNGIGMNTGTFNNRAVGVKWMAGEESYLNDVKFVGGHGTMLKPGQDRSAVQNLELAWDNQYWSLWITGNGGGTIKNIWSANTYAATGLYVSNTSTPTKMYAISLEHHVREEARFDNVCNFKVYGLQFEEETREGRDDLAMTMTSCHDMMFANTWFYRVIRIKTPRNYGVYTSNCSDIEFRNMRAWTQILCLTAATVYDSSKDIAIWPNDFAYAVVKGTEKSAVPEGKPFEAVRIGKDYEFATGACSDSEGNVYFCENRLKKIYRYDAQSRTVSLYADYPWKPFSLVTDTDDNLIVICRYDQQPGYDDPSRPVNIEDMADNNWLYSSWGNGGWAMMVYAIDKADGMVPLKLVKTSSIKASRIIYPTHRWREDFDKVSQELPEYSYLAPDGKTIIPQSFDLCRSVQLQAVVPGQQEPVYQAWEDYKKTARFSVNTEGGLEKVEMNINHGEYGLTTDPDGNLYLAEGQIFVLAPDGKEIRRINVPERPLSITLGGKDKDILFVTTNESLFKIDIE